ncbi:ATP-grasp domain-containing protein [Shewanella waksmanii]|uniref:ATP-grasp domain-containing protein n=1 Tax=Shewanella waksmanii TaxID=213783 RepID=UPI0004B5EA3D|nr:ATP-grasp domain-containing protein [Shewanella waksmanii]
MATVKHLLVLGAGADQVYMIQTAQSMGIKTVAVDLNPQAPGLFLADYSKAIDFSDVKSVIDYCESLIEQGVNLAGVATMGSDIPHLIAQIASHFNWRGPSQETARWATHKYQMKRRLVTMGIPVPSFALVQTESDVMRNWQDWRCEKVIIKPTDRAGSRGVRIIADQTDIQDALTHAKSFSLNNEILLEEYIPGRQISTESIIVEQRSCTPGFADRVYEGMECFWPNIMENGGWLPSSLTSTEKHDICLLVEKTARALGVNCGVAKGDVVICPSRGPMIIEMAARLSGGDFAASLVPLATGINYVKSVINLALGKDVNLKALTAEDKCAVANRYFFLPPGKLEAIEGIDWLGQQEFCCKVEFYPSIGEQLHHIQSHGDRAGVFVLKADNRSILAEYIELVYSTLKFKIDGHWYSGRPTSLLE